MWWRCCWTRRGWRPGCRTSLWLNNSSPCLVYWTFQTKLEGACMYLVYLSVACTGGTYTVSKGLLHHPISSTACRRRLGKLLCDLLVMPGLPAGLTESVLAEQKHIWPQESYRYPTRWSGVWGGGTGERLWYRLNWPHWGIAWTKSKFITSVGPTQHTCTAWSVGDHYYRITFCATLFFMCTKTT